MTTATSTSEPTHSDEDIIWDEDPSTPATHGYQFRRIPLIDLAALRHPAVTRLISGDLVPVAAFNSSI